MCALVPCQKEHGWRLSLKLWGAYEGRAGLQARVAIDEKNPSAFGHGTSRGSSSACRILTRTVSSILAPPNPPPETSFRTGPRLRRSRCALRPPSSPASRSPSNHPRETSVATGFYAAPGSHHFPARAKTSHGLPSPPSPSSAWLHAPREKIPPVPAPPGR